MEQYELKEMLTHVADGSVSVEEAVRRLKRAPFEEIGIASLDAHRGIRQGASEIIYGAGKTAAQIVKIAETLRSGGQQTILITRVDAEKADILGTDTDEIIDDISLKIQVAKLYRAIAKVLTPRERTVIIKRYGLDGGEALPQREIASALGISRSYVSRIEKKALEKLRSGLEEGQS